MANELHYKILNQGVNWWNTWRQKNSSIKPDLSGLKLIGLDFSRVNFSNTNLSHTSFERSKLINANFRDANLTYVKFSFSKLICANFDGAKINYTVFKNADLSRVYIKNPKHIKECLKKRIETYFEISGCNPDDIDKINKDYGIKSLDDLNLFYHNENEYFKKHKKIFLKTLSGITDEWKDERERLKRDLLRPSNKINQWVYFLVWFILVIIFDFLFTKVFALDYSHVLGLIAMFFATPAIYLIYTKIEKGIFDFSNSLRLSIGVLKLVCMCTFLFLPFYLLVEFEILEGIVIYLIVNVSVIILMGLLATILSWINNTSPREELGKSKEFLGV